MNTRTISTQAAQATTSEPNIHARPVGFLVYLKGGAIAGAIAAVVNNLWNLIAPALGAARVPEVINYISITLASFFPALIASVGLWISVKLFKAKGAMIFAAGALILGALSVIPSFGDTMQDGTAMPAGFALLSVPMHLFSTVIIVAVLLRTTRKSA